MIENPKTLWLTKDQRELNGTDRHGNHLPRDRLTMAIMTTWPVVMD